MSRSCDDYTVACICPMGVELAPVKAMLDEIHPPLETSRDQNSYTLGTIAGHNVVVAVLPETGTNAAAATAVQLLNDFPAIRFGLLVGIGGGVPDNEEEGDDIQTDVRLGDVVVSKPNGTLGGVVQYDLGKWVTGGNFERTGSLNKPPAVLRASMESLAADHRMKGSQISQLLSTMMEKYPLMADEYSHPGVQHDRLFRASYSHQKGRTCSKCDENQMVNREVRRVQQSRVHYGTIASANTVVKDTRLRDKLQRDMQVLCVEMEAAGLMNDFPCLVIRGICDYADSHKNKRWQPYAAAVAAAYMKELLSVIPALSVLQSMRARELLVADQETHQLLSQGIKLQERMLGQNQEQSQRQETRQRNEEDERCLRTLKSTDYQGQKDRNPNRMEGTCRWVLEHPLFQQWHQSERDSLLWISADPGCGKSVLARSLIDHDLRQGYLDTDKSRTICYFFFKDNEEQDRLAVALCAVLHQLFNQQPHLLHHAVALYRRDGDRIRQEAHTLWGILRAAMADLTAQPVICVFDALDECDDDDRQRLIRWICDYHQQFSPGRKSVMSSNPAIKFLVTSRPEDRVQRWFGRALEEMAQIRVEGEKENDRIREEINLVVDHQVNLITAEFHLSSLSENRLRQSLQNMQHRTYLWLYLSTEAIRDAFRDSIDPEQVEVHQLLPKDVEDAYDKILGKVKPAQQLFVRQILLIIVGARRALSIGELATALETSRQRNRSRMSKVDRDHLERHIRDWCRLFIYINHSKLYLIHQTAKEFLMVPDAELHVGNTDMSAMGLTGWKSCFTMSIVELEMARICIDHLFRVLDEEQIAGPTEFNEYCAEHWLWHFQDDDSVQDESLRRQVLLLYDHRGKAFQWWFPLMWRRLKRHEKRPQLLAQHVAAMRGHGNILSVIQQRADFDIEARDSRGSTALTWATVYNHKQIVQTLLAAGADINAQGGSYGNALQAASVHGHETIVLTLLAAGADINAQGGSYGNALEAASVHGHETIVQTLLAAGADINAQGASYGNALRAASASGYETIVQTLLVAGANINAQGGYYGDALQAASAEGHETIVQTLLAAGADINAQRGYYGNSLQAASVHGHETIVQTLLAAGADINAPGGSYGNALQTVSVHGHETIVLTLLAAGADINAQGGFYGNALQAASACGHETIVQTLLAAGADINAQGGFYSNALQAASACGHKTIVQTLRAAGTQIQYTRS